MIKNIFILASIFMISVHAMELENKWNIALHGTTIHVIQGDVLGYYADGEEKVDYIVVGQYAQEGKFSCCGSDSFIGRCWEASRIYFVTKNQNNNCKRRSFRIEKGVEIGTSWYFPVRQDCNICISISEPYVSGDGKGYCNYTSRRFDDNEGIIFGYHERAEAIEEALKDVGVCYEKVLAYVAEKNDKKLEKSIALPTLGVETTYLNVLPKEKAAPVAVEAILEFIKNNPKMYDRIELFVEEDFEVDLYKELLMQWRGKENVLLFYFAQKDSEHLISLLLPELIGYIAKLI